MGRDLVKSTSAKRGDWIVQGDLGRIEIMRSKPLRLLLALSLAFSGVTPQALADVPPAPASESAAAAAPAAASDPTAASLTTTTADESGEAESSEGQSMKPVFRGRGRGKNSLEEDTTQGTPYTNQFKKDPVLKSQYSLNGEQLEVDPD
jgi:hypothetical protein